MGILHGKKNTSHASHRFDPFEGLDDSVTDKNLFADLSVVADVPIRRSTINAASVGYGDTLANNVRQNRRAKTYILAALVVAASGFAFARFKPWTYFNSQEIVYAYFEVRALDANGRPIAGAIVKNGGKRVGTTDSFGEWRRYMKVPLGATVPVTLAKKGVNQLLYATKNFAVPPAKPEKSEIELRGSVQLQVTDINDLTAKSAVSVSPNDMVRLGTAAKVTQAEASGHDGMTLTAINDDQKVKSSQASVHSVDSANIKSPKSGSLVAKNFTSSHESIWFELNGSQASALNREVLPALKRRATEMGLRLDPNAKWKVRLSSLIEKPHRLEKDGGGLIQVTSFDGENSGVAREFLRAYSPDSSHTAKGILFILARHVNKNVLIERLGDRWVAALGKSTPDIWKLSTGSVLSGEGGSFTLGADEYSDEKFHGYYLTHVENDPCVKGVNGCEMSTRSFGDIAPVPSWTKLRLKVGSLGKEPVKIFVSGYEAKPIGDRVYEYWGQDKTRANVTIVQMGRVLHRGQVVNDAANPSMVAVANISRR